MSLKICHITTMTSLGGVEMIVQDYLTAHTSEEIKNFLICTSYKESIIKPIVDSGVEVCLPKRYFRYDLSIFIRMRSWARKNGIDIFHSYNSYANNVANILSIISGIPLICSEHGTIWQTKGLRFLLDRYAYKRSTSIIANSEASKTLLIYRYGLKNDKIKVINNPVRIETPLNTKEDTRKAIGIKKKFVIGTICRLVPLKGVDIIIKAAQLLLEKRSDVQFLIVGDGDERNRLENINNNYKGKKDVIFLGWREDAREVLKIFDVFVSASLRESFGNSMVEASSEGIPVVAPHIDGIPEAVKDSKSGILISPKRDVSSKRKRGLTGKSVVEGCIAEPKSIEEEELCDTLNYLLDNEKIRKELGGYGKEHSENFGLTIYAANINSLYFGLFDGK